MPHRRSHRPLAQRQVRREGTVKRSAGVVGQGQQADRARALRRAAARHHQPPEGPGTVRPGSVRWRGPCLPPAGAFHSRVGVAELVRAEPVHRSARCRPQGLPAPVHRDDGALVQGGTGASRHALGCGDRGQSRVARNPDLRHELRRREQEVDFHGPQLPVAAAGCAVDALLGEHRCRRRHRAVLRPFGHRQDHAVQRSGPPVDRRRRARLERSRRVQLRRRLLCQDHPPLR